MLCALHLIVNPYI